MYVIKLHNKLHNQKSKQKVPAYFALVHTHLLYILPTYIVERTVYLLFYYLKSFSKI
jgi:hypothetical protein